MAKQVNRDKIRRLRRYVRRRKAIYDRVQRTLSGFKSYEQLFIILAALFIGTTAGYVAAGFRLLIELFQTALWGAGPFVDVVRSTPTYLKLAIPALGGTAVALFIHRFAKEAKGHGVPEVMDAVASRSGFIRMRVVLVKAIASALSIGSGGSVGREGPIVQIGSALGSTIGQLFQVSARRMKTFVGCGAAAGIAATFNAPVAGAIFASEVILGDFSISSIGPIMIASVLGTVISHGIYGDYPAFVPPIYQLQAPIELVFYGILGLGAGLAGWVFVRLLYLSEDFFDRLRFPVGAKALLGGALLGSIGMIAPEVLGVGYESMNLVLAGQLSFLLVAGLVLAKILATTITLSSGGSGGIFAPSLFIGSMLGYAFGFLFHTFFPEVTAPPGAYALVGMAAVVAATTHAPITAIIIIFEMTTEYTVILPLIISSIIATGFTTRFLEGSIYTIKLKRRGVDIHAGTDINVLNQLSVDRIKQQLVEIVEKSVPVEELLARMSSSTDSIFYVCEDSNRFYGVVTQGIIRRFLNRFEEIPPGTRTSDICNTLFPSISDETPLNEAFRLMLEMDIDALPVLDSSKRISGQVRRSDILREYQELLMQIQSTQSLAAGIKYVHRYFHEKTEVIPGFLVARIDIPSLLVNSTVHSLNVRKKYDIDVLLIRKKATGGFKDIIPSPSTRMNRGDQLLIFGKKEKVELFCRLA